MQLPRKSDGDSGNCGCFGRLDSNAVYSHDYGTLDARGPNSFVGQNANAAKLIQVNVSMGWGDSDIGAWAIYCNGPLIKEKRTLCNTPYL
jgi:hypothetical protein